MSLTLNNPYWKKLAEEHRAWLAAFDPQYLANWEKMLKADSEAALCEAGVRQRLQAEGVSVEPNERLTGNCGGPDFRCSIKDSTFYVEVTCISISTVEARTGLPAMPSPGMKAFPPFGMTEAVFAECVNKAKQCGNLDAPALVAVGTFHTEGAMLGFKKIIVASVLTGKTKIAWNIDMATGQQAGDTFQMTELESAAFLKPDKTQEVGFARSSISGVLLCGLGCLPGQFLGVLHPNPARPFDPALLPGVNLGQVQLDRTSRQLHVTWSRSDDDD